MLCIDLSDKVAIVTGGAGAIGSEICKVLALCGASVVINYMNSAEAAELLADDINKHGSKALTIKANVCDQGDIANLLSKVINEFGRLDILVNNAGTTLPGNMKNLSYEDWDKVVRNNLDGAFNCSKQALPFLSDSKKGAIINISSTSAITGGSHGPHYAASKAALLGFTRSLAKELGPLGITINCIAPTMIDSKLLQARYPAVSDRDKLIEQIPVRRMGKPEDVGYLVAYLASPLASFITGQMILLDGGRTFR
jgi:3-oxoacyl-[acyl-carrier protein] reductase